MCKVRFSTFIQKQKPSVQRLKVAMLLSRFDKTRGEVIVKDPISLKNHLSDLVFKGSLGDSIKRR